MPKWEYIRNEATGLYLPDENFPHIRHAWEMIIAGATRSKALAYLHTHNVSRMTKLSCRNKHPRLMVIGDHAMTTIFRDPFYYGVLVQAGHAVDLKQLYPDFKPVVTEEEFNIVQAQTKDRSRREITYFEPLKPERQRLFLPFRHMIARKQCGHYMIVSRLRGRCGILLKRPLPMGRMSTQPKRHTRWCNSRGYVRRIIQATLHRVALRRFCKEYARIRRRENGRHSSS